MESGSRPPFSHPCCRDSVLLCCHNFVTSSLRQNLASCQSATCSSLPSMTRSCENNRFKQRKTLEPSRFQPTKPLHNQRIATVPPAPTTNNLAQATQHTPTFSDQPPHSHHNTQYCFVLATYTTPRLPLFRTTRLPERLHSHFWHPPPHLRPHFGAQHRLPSWKTTVLVAQPFFPHSTKTAHCFLTSFNRFPAHILNTV